MFITCVFVSWEAVCSVLCGTCVSISSQCNSSDQGPDVCSCSYLSTTVSLSFESENHGYTMCPSFRSVSQFKPFLILAALITAETVLLLHTMSLYRQSLRSPPYTVTSTNLTTQSDNLIATGLFHTFITLKTLNVKLDENLKPLQPKVAEQDMFLLQEIVATFSIAMTKASLTFFLYSGSLLGSWRHHGLVPWDDDLDVAVPSWQKDAVAHVLNGLKPHFLLDVSQGVRWKLFSARSHAISRVTWKWPFLDITFYEENRTHMWDQDQHFRDFVFNKEDVLPLSERPFMDMMLPAPRNTKAVLSTTYNLSVCESGWYDHSKEMIRSELKSVPCEQLQQVFPFVRRQAAVGGHGGCNESLVLNGNVLAWVVLSGVQC
ncbi:uncharacterized protein LOC112554247 isoform X2 [Pomacea canaliculata]|uniref:uncharacterized protein LOC112554247 isoform X2 n=1 Tax=Pomacea canaliculata TaxID=400727 RepID=UPI000D7384FD|nr:uncharacterized protein LOC112554247 isoform X2 [Pomacea canaliculata]